MCVGCCCVVVFLYSVSMFLCSGSSIVILCMQHIPDQTPNTKHTHKKRKKLRTHFDHHHIVLSFCLNFEALWVCVCVCVCVLLSHTLRTSVGVRFGVVAKMYSFPFIHQSTLFFGRRFLCSENGKKKMATNTQSTAKYLNQKKIWRNVDHLDSLLSLEMCTENEEKKCYRIKDYYWLLVVSGWRIFIFGRKTMRNDFNKHINDQMYSNHFHSTNEIFRILLGSANEIFFFLLLNYWLSMYENHPHFFPFWFFPLHKSFRAT